MALPKFAADFKSKAIASSFAAIMMASPMAANADNNNSHNSSAQSISAVSSGNTQNNTTIRYFDSSLDAFDAADEYARLNNATGVIVAYGHLEQFPTPESLGDLIVGELVKRKEKAEYFIYKMAPTRGAAIGYTNGMTSRGPLGLNDAAQQMNDFVLETRRLRAEFSYTPKPNENPDQSILLASTPN